MSLLPASDCVVTCLVLKGHDFFALQLAIQMILSQASGQATLILTLSKASVLTT